MSMHTVRIAIVGAGLSGLYAAYLLERQGITDYVLLEGREVLGGRIASIDATGQAVTHIAANTDGIDRFDLGPTWFWPGYQYELGRLVEALGLERFEQFEEGDMMVERSPEEPPVRMRGYVNSPASMRLAGGMGRLTEALRDELAPANIITGHTVRRLRKHHGCIELESENAAGHVSAWQAEHVLLALPPRLVESTIAFEPALPASLALQWRETATWMAPQAKYVAIYDTPFWREQGLSGEGRSARGPLGEIHDASMPGGSAALFGFLGVPARVRSTVSDEVLRTHCRAQLVRMFGPLAATPKAEAIKDWAQDPRTATAVDVNAAAQHSRAPSAKATSGPWQGCLTGIASEWSPQFSGYLAGAVEAAGLGVKALTEHASAAALNPSKR
ncbi:FAD-dependent oxidoreductase [Pseudomonas sp. F8002]|nr:FAD-dependent oxidoreductase [Pseudomonas sp. F8002]